MPGLLGWRNIEVQRDRDMRERIYSRRDRVRKVVGVRGNRDVRRTRECDGVVRTRRDLVGAGRNCSRDVHSREMQWPSSKTIRNPQPNFGSAER